MSTRVLRKSRVYDFLLLTISLCLTTIGLELTLRLYHGRLFDFQSVAHRPLANPIASYDAQLGWIPRSGYFSESDWDWTVDESRLRSNGRPAPKLGRAILAVGDSFTFGDEVRDAETWPSQLENILQKPVLNAGVFAYGIDQTYLRTKKLLGAYEPSVVIFAFISNDIQRTELSYYQGKWKPYFVYSTGGLELRNVPVRKGFVASRPFPMLNRALGYSYLTNAVLTRTPFRAWYFGPEHLREHHDGEKVAVELLTGLDRLVKLRGMRFVAMTLATDGRIGGNEKLPEVVRSLRENGVQVLDLAAQMLQMPKDRFARMFVGAGHHGPEMNGWVAAELAAFLREESAINKVESDRTETR